MDGHSFPHSSLPGRVRRRLLPRVALGLAGLVALAGCVPSVASESPNSVYGPGSLEPLVWATRATMPTPRDKPLAVAVGTKIYVIGGAISGAVLNTVEEYDVSTNTWTNCGGVCTPIPTGVWQTAGGEQDGNIYVLGGFTDGSGTSSTASVQVFHPGANTWDSDCNGNLCDDVLSSHQEAQVATASSGGAIYLVGGGVGGLGNEIMQFDAAQPSSGMFIQCGGCLLPVSRSRMGAIRLGDKLYTLGGWQGGTSTDEFYEFDLTIGDYTDCGGACPVLPRAGMDGKTGTSGGVIYVVGLTDNPPEDNVHSFDTATFTWNNCGGSCPPIPFPLGGSAHVQVGSNLHLIGGDNGGGTGGFHLVLPLP